MNDSQPTLSVQNLETHFFTKEGVAKAVNGVSFDIAKGEKIVIIFINHVCSQILSGLSPSIHVLFYTFFFS